MGLIKMVLERKGLYDYECSNEKEKKEKEEIIKFADKYDFSFTLFSFITIPLSLIAMIWMSNFRLSITIIIILLLIWGFSKSYLKYINIKIDKLLG